MAAVGMAQILVGALAGARRAGHVWRMTFDRPLIRATLARRYNRFLADVILPDGRTATAHCPNPGAMLGVADPGMAVWVEPTDGRGRKLAFAWRLVELPGGHWAGIDTQTPNRLVAEALAARGIAELAAWPDIRAEARYGERSRVDFLLTGPGLPPAYVEVKNVHLRREDDWAEFPDCVTARGAKHLGELARMAEAGARAVTLYVIQRTDCARLRMAADLDPAYARAFADARARGVEALARVCAISPEGVRLAGPVPVA
jgi:sugar fermentation stimulation protein A